MLAYLLVLLLVSSVRGSVQSYLLGFDENCVYTREDAIQCFSKYGFFFVFLFYRVDANMNRYVDTDHNGVISLKELEAAQKNYVGWALKLLKWVVR